MKGGLNAFDDGVIKAIPDATSYHLEREPGEGQDETTPIEDRTGIQDCYLEAAANYLEVDGVQYNSLAKAYNAITGDSGTIKVIANASVEAVLPESPSNKTIVFDLNGYQLTYTQSIINNSTMTILDSSENETGKLINANNALETVINNNSLTMENGYISSNYIAVHNTEGSTFVMNSGTIHSTGTGIKNTGNYGNTSDGRTKTVTVNINNDSKIDAVTTGIYSTRNTNITLSNNASIKVYCPNYTTISGIYYYTASGSTVTLKDNASIDVRYTSDGQAYRLAGIFFYNYGSGGGKIIMEDNSSVYTSAKTYSSSASVFVERSSENTELVVKDNASISDVSSFTSDGSTAISGFNKVTISGGRISALTTNENNTSGATAIISNSSATLIISGGEISASATKGDANGVRLGSVNTITGGTITTHSNSGISSGLINETNTDQTTTITGGTITSTTNSGTAYGGYFSGSGNTITGGTITSDTYGIYANTSERWAGYVTIGVNEEPLSITTPEIIGKKYALYGNSFDFYDGILKGSLSAYYDGVVKKIADDTTINITGETIGELDYDVRYLVAETDVAQINTTKYTKLKDAVDAAETGDVIELLADNYLFYPLNIVAEKDFTIKTNGYDIVTGSPIVNNGKVIIINNNYESSSPVFDYNSSGYYITNNTGASMEMTNININSIKGIDNYGTLKLSNTKIISTNTSINNTGNIIASNDSAISGGNYALYNNGGESTFDGVTFGESSIYNNAGKLTITNSEASYLVDNAISYITNNSELILDNTNVSLSNVCRGDGIGNDTICRAVYNTGVLSINNQSTITHIIRNNPNGYKTAIYNDGENANLAIAGSTITLDDSATTSNYRASYGIYNTNGHVTVESGAVHSGNAKATTYGIYNETGIITLGVPEQPGPTYGKEDADVSTTDPDIKAIGSSSGIGIKNASGGKVYFYDGSITGSTSAMPENPNGTEYMFDPKDYTDENNYHYCILEWRREQPGN